jgi:adenosylmethionine-8-amino-7-oxononanoate aminotransferase
MKKEYLGLITDEQNKVNVSQGYWNYGRLVEGEKQLDPLLNWGCNVLGFFRHDIYDYVFDNIKKYKHEVAESIVSDRDDIFLNDVNFTLSEKLYEMCNYRSIPVTSGSVANEAAIKLSSAYHYIKKNNNKNKIAYIKDGYHGSTFLTSNISDNLFEKFKNYNLDPYQNIQQVDRSLDNVNFEDTMCIIVETCSYSNALTPYTYEFWKKLEIIREKYDVLIIVDDVFTGGGKTGNYFGVKGLPISPNMFTMGKAITNGFFPLAQMFYDETIHKTLPENFSWQFGFTHSFTLPGTLAALKYIDILEKENILENHYSLKKLALDLFDSLNVKVINNYGTMFMLKKHLIQIPLNADSEYFTSLEKFVNDSYR